MVWPTISMRIVSPGSGAAPEAFATVRVCALGTPSYLISHLNVDSLL
jgi:hypothetical protein